MRLPRLAPPGLGGLTVLVAAGTACLRLATVPVFVESSDGWSFVSGVERYSVAESRPHWPGYPVYVGAGKVMAALVGDPVAGLHLLSILASAATAIPLMRLAHAWCPHRGDTSRLRAAGVAGGAWAFLPLPWTCGTEILSEPLALLLAVTALWWSGRAREGGPAERALWASGLASGAMLGARLAYAPLCAPFLYAASRAPVGPARRRALGVLLATALAVTAVSAAVGGTGWLHAASTRLAEHFGSWPRRVLEDGRWLARAVGLTRTLLVHGIGGWWPGLPLSRLLVTFVVGGAMAIGVVRLARHPSVDVRWLFAAAALPYAASVGLAHDPDLSRHCLALVALGCVAAACAMPAERGARIASVAILGVALTAGLPAAKMRRDTPPLAHRLAQHVASRLPAGRTAVIVTSDVPYVRPYLERLAPGIAVYSAHPWEVERTAAAGAARGLAVYSTAPDTHAPERWRPVACFRRPPLSESRGPYDLWLYGRDVRDSIVGCEDSPERAPIGNGR